MSDMNTSPSADLDAEELLHLAIAASDRDQPERAIELLKRAIAANPADARAHHLLGAEHAQLGLFERAAEEMQRAIELDPELDAARFQLGLLQLSSRQPQSAEATWQALERLGDVHFYVLFKNGLLHLARDEFADAARCLRAGLEANRTLEPLNRDMQGMLAQVEALQAEHGGGDAGGPGGHLFLDAYKRQH
jgi:tetratricopeptide (TPR) repeat protein